MRNTDQEEHPLLVTLPGQLLEAALSHKLPTGLDQIVISNLEVRTNLNSRQQLGNNIISGNFLYILYICLQYPTFILALCSKSMSMNLMMWWCFDEINQDDNSYQVPLKLHQFDKVLRLLQFGRKLLDDCPHLCYSSYSDTCIIIMYKYKCMVYYIWQFMMTRFSDSFSLVESFLSSYDRISYMTDITEMTMQRTVCCTHI